MRVKTTLEKHSFFKLVLVTSTFPSKQQSCWIFSTRSNFTKWPIDFTMLFLAENFVKKHLGPFAYGKEDAHPALLPKDVLMQKDRMTVNHAGTEYTTCSHLSADEYWTRKLQLESTLRSGWHQTTMTEVHGKGAKAKILLRLCFTAKPQVTATLLVCCTDWWW